MSLSARPNLQRVSGDHMVAGVCAGFAHHFGIDIRWMRWGFLVAGFMGIGIVVYLLAMLLMPGDDGSLAPAQRVRLRGWLDYVALSAVTVGVVQLFGVVSQSWLVAIVVGGLASLAIIAVISLLPQDATSVDAMPSWVPPAMREAIRVVRGRRGLAVRVIAGSVLAAIGVVLLLLESDSWTRLGVGLAEIVLVVIGVALAFGPWISRLGNDLLLERRERIRSDERADVAAHLHDSVLQTLALVQRNAHDAREVARLARLQERELREWLLRGDNRATESGMVCAEIDALASELEALHSTPVDVVHVRDCEMNDQLQVLVAATREAIANAQVHSGADRIAVFTEVEPQSVRVFVRDRGRGFERDLVDADRRGVRESIVGRMQRHGGEVRIHSAIDSGTEVELLMPRGAR